jgi:hypothetical protein
MDLERLLRTLTIVFRDQATGTFAALGTHEKGKVPAEAVAFARYAMFGNVYWHHAYRAIKAMIHRVVWEALAQGYSDTGGKDRFRRELKDFVCNGDTDGQQPSLFPTDKQHNIISQIQYGDLGILNWLAKRAKPIGPAFVDLLASRKLFKRVLVLSNERARDKALWAKLSAFYVKNKTNWETKVELQKEFQLEVIKLVEAKPQKDWRQSSSVTDGAYAAFLQAAKTEVILLVDLPADRSGSETELEFIVEEDRRRVKIDEMLTGNREASIVWKVLQDSFQLSIGKLRAFCHPDHEEFLSAFLERNEIEDALSSALKSVD